MEFFGTVSAPRLRWKLEGYCPRPLLGSYALRALGRALGPELVGLPVFPGLSVLLGDPLSHHGIWIWSTVAQNPAPGTDRIWEDFVPRVTPKQMVPTAMCASLAGQPLSQQRNA